MNVILILTISPLSDYKNSSPSVSKRKLSQRSLSKRPFSSFAVHVHWSPHHVYTVPFVRE